MLKNPLVFGPMTIFMLLFGHNLQNPFMKGITKKTMDFFCMFPTSEAIFLLTQKALHESTPMLGTWYHGKNLESSTHY